MIKSNANVYSGFSLSHSLSPSFSLSPTHLHFQNDKLTRNLFKIHDYVVFVFRPICHRVSHRQCVNVCTWVQFVIIIFFFFESIENTQVGHVNLISR